MKKAKLDNTELMRTLSKFKNLTLDTPEILKMNQIESIINTLNAIPLKEIKCIDIDFSEEVDGSIGFQIFVGTKVKNLPWVSGCYTASIEPCGDWTTTSAASE